MITDLLIYNTALGGYGSFPDLDISKSLKE